MTESLEARVTFCENLTERNVRNLFETLILLVNSLLGFVYVCNVHIDWIGCTLRA